MADHSVPSGNAMAAGALLSLGILTNRDDLHRAGERSLQAAAGVMSSSSQAAAQALRVLQRYVRGSTELVLVGGTDLLEWNSALQACQRCYLPQALLVARSNRDLQSHTGGELTAHLLQDRLPIEGRTTLFVCRDQTCEAPFAGLPAILERLDLFQAQHVGMKHALR